jgi:hypothetical protein
MRLFAIVFTVAFLGLALAGCGRRVTIASPYQPGSRLLLVYECDFMLPTSRDIQHRCSTVEWPVLVNRSDAKVQKKLEIKFRRMASGRTLVSPDGTVCYSVSEDSAATAPGDAEEYIVESNKALNKLLKRFELKVTLDEADKIVHYSEGLGSGYGILAKPKVGKEDTPTDKLWRKIGWGAYLTTLNNATAYLPRKPVAIWSSWRVQRELVIPHDYYTFIDCSGTGMVSEDAVCRLDAVRQSPIGTIAVIRFRGERYCVPEFKAPAPRFRAMPSSGEIHVQIDSGHIIFARIETQILYKPGEYDEDVTLVEKFTVTPDTAKNEAEK